MTYSEFLDILQSHGRYESPAHQVRCLPRKVRCWATLKFHCLNLSNVVNNYLIARRGDWNHARWSEASFNTVRHCEASGATVVVEGFQHICDLNEPVVYVANHMSLLETFVLKCLTAPAGESAFVIKQSLLDYPLFGPILRAGNPVAVSRRDPRQDLKTVLQQGRERLDAGTSMIIFPQATRSVEFSTRRFNSLGARLAARAGVPVMPVAIRTDFLRPGKLVRDLGSVDPRYPVCFAFSEPLRSTDTKTLHAGSIAAIRGWLEKWNVPCE